MSEDKHYYDELRSKTSYILNSYVASRGETLFTARPDGSWIITMDGYAVVPKEEWEARSWSDAQFSRIAELESGLQKMQMREHELLEKIMALEIENARLRVRLAPWSPVESFPLNALRHSR